MKSIQPITTHTFKSSGAEKYVKSFSLIFVVRVESYNNFGSSNLVCPIACLCSTERIDVFIDLVSNFQIVKPANEYEPEFIPPEKTFC